MWPEMTNKEMGKGKEEERYIQMQHNIIRKGSKNKNNKKDKGRNRKKQR